MNKNFNSMKYLFKANSFYLKKLWSKSKLYFLYKIFYIVINGLIPIAWVYYPKLFLDCILNEKNFVKAVIIVICFTVFSYLWYLVISAADIYFKKVLGIVKYEVKDAIVNKIIKNQLISYDDPEYFNQMSRALSYADNGGKTFIDSISNFSSVIISFSGVAYIVTRIHWFMILLFLASVIINYFVTLRVQKNNFNFNRERTVRSRFIGNLYSVFSNKDSITEVKLNTCDDFIKRKINKEFIKDLMLNIKNDFKVLKIQQGIIICTNVNQIIMYIYFGFLLFKNFITVSDYTMLFQATGQFSSDFNQIITNIANLNQQALDAYNFYEFLENETYTEPYKEDGVKFNPSSFKSISFDHVTFKYLNQNHYTIKDMNFTINKGEKIALVGENGAGKTTLIKLLLGFYNPEKGNIKIDDIDIKSHDIKSFWENVSVIFQNHQEYCFSIAENIAMNENFDVNKINNIINFVGLDDKISLLKYGINTAASKTYDYNGTEFSGGEKQKLSLARALYKKSEILIMDEPSSSLDPIAEHELFESIKNMSNDKTVIFISHRLSTTISADRIFLIDDGKIIESGSHKELMNLNGKYAQMFNMQAENYREEKHK